MRKISKRKLAAFAAGTLALCTAAGTWAYYTSASSMDNKMSTKTYGNTLEEKFTPQRDWQPGQTATKEVGVINTGDYDLVARVKLKEEWTRNSASIAKIDPTDTTGMSAITTVEQANATDGSTTGDKTVVEKTMAASGWTKGGDGYWYYNAKLVPKTSTSPKLLTAIKLTSAVDMGVIANKRYWTESAAVSATDPSKETIGTDSKTKWVEYTGDIPAPADPQNSVYTRVTSGLDPAAMGYAGAQYTLTVESQTCQATKDAVAATWTTAPVAVVTGWDLK